VSTRRQPVGGEREPAPSVLAPRPAPSGHMWPLLATGVAGVSPPAPPPPHLPTFCSPEGFNSGPTGVTLDFLGAELVINNLAGYGPDFDLDKYIRYRNLGFDFDIQQRFDLVVSNTSYYKPNKVKRNGRTFNGEFGSINLADDEECSFQYDFRNYNAETLYTLNQNFGFCLFDFDQGEAGRLSETLTVCNVVEYATVEEVSGGQIANALDIQDLGPDPNGAPGTRCWSFESTLRGYGSDNPERPSQVLIPVSSMTEFVKENVAPKYVCLTFPAGENGFAATYAVSASEDPGFSGRNFLFSGQTSTTLPSLYLPCYYCISSGEGTPSCTGECSVCGGPAVGTSSGGETIPFCSEGLVPTLPECEPREFAADCYPGSPGTGANAYPACKASCSPSPTLWA